MPELFIYEEVVDFIARSNPRNVLEFKPSEAANQRVSGLLEKEREGKITDEEKKELDYFLMLEHIMRLAKAKARKLLNAA
jgi:uncharacterized protein YggL (DUF469 family)